LSEFLDELARTLARPMSRRKALRLFGGALVSASVPAALVPRRAWSLPQDCNARGGGCISTARCCYTSDGYAGSCCPWYFKCSKTGSGLCAEQYICEDGRDFCGPHGSKICCSANEVCFKGVCIEPCPPDQQVCNKVCCPKGTECVRTTMYGQRIETCAPKCPGRRARCGLNCCPTNWRCQNPDRGICRKCGTQQEECGQKCCDKHTSYCADPSHSKCCPKNASSCPTGPVTAPRRTCCTKPNRCLRQLPAASGGLTAGSPYVCCPPNRIAKNNGEPFACCAPGQVSLGEKLVVGFGIQGFCCNESQLCGSGGNQTCCQRFSQNIGTDLNQTCCDGKCVTLKHDPSNCGRCGQACPPGQRCDFGVCRA
jgi:hypothetical protein